MFGSNWQNSFREYQVFFVILVNQKQESFLSDQNEMRPGSTDWNRIYNRTHIEYTLEKTERTI
jgi:hypothetical protein